MREFRPPKEVQEASSLLKRGKPASLETVRKVYREGGVGRRWARRVLRQEGLLKSSASGDFILPEVFDLLAGPNILAAVYCGADAETLSKDFEEGGLITALIDLEDGGTLVLCEFSGDVPEGLSKATLSVDDSIDCSNAILISESPARLGAVLKANRAVGFNCFSAPDDVELPQDPDEVCLLCSQDCFEQQNMIAKVDDELGLVFGWAIVSKVDGEEYFDLQDEHIPEASMLEASTDFMLSSRVQGEMHFRTGEGEVVDKGRVAFAWPMTEEVAGAFGVDTHQTGLMVAVKPDDEAILDKFRDGTYTGFSIGGRRVLSEPVEEV